MYNYLFFNRFPFNKYYFYHFSSPLYSFMCILAWPILTRWYTCRNPPRLHVHKRDCRKLPPRGLRLLCVANDDPSVSPRLHDYTKTTIALWVYVCMVHWRIWNNGALNLSNKKYTILKLPKLSTTFYDHSFELSTDFYKITYSSRVPSLIRKQLMFIIVYLNLLPPITNLLSYYKIFKYIFKRLFLSLTLCKIQYHRTISVVRHVYKNGTNGQR